VRDAVSSIQHGLTDLVTANPAEELGMSFEDAAKATASGTAESIASFAVGDIIGGGLHAAAATQFFIAAATGGGASSGGTASAGGGASAGNSATSERPSLQLESGPEGRRARDTFETTNIQIFQFGNGRSGLAIADALNDEVRRNPNTPFVDGRASGGFNPMEF